MTQTIKIQHLPPEAIRSLMLHLPDYVKVALMEKATQLECSLEAAIEMAIASFLDSEALSFEDCLLSQRLKESELVESPQRK
ncbi:MAG: hypothetical protein EAZ09_17920 [Oscillatoriales cyanobacterium]|nr:MAG: hypothetical protein EAZ18_18405 [Oscillatoriales cyanobacterium]TAH18634.1 MAG: hypothetical protein EAZ09_17920 [Oscillatoriales cyanobacterium]